MNELTRIIPLDDQLSLGLRLPADATFEDWSKLGRRLCMGARAINWLIGDWLIAGVEKFGEQARDEANTIFRSDVDRFDPIVRTCRKFPEDRRHDRLSFGHHLAVVTLEDEEAQKLLSDAEERRLPVREVRREVMAHRVSSGGFLPRDDDDPDDTMMRAIVHAWNRASRQAREDFLELATEADFGVIDL